MAELQRCNAISDVERYIEGIHPDTEIMVIASNQYYYIEEPGAFVRNWERVLYEGPAKKFTCLPEMY